MNEQTRFCECCRETMFSVGSNLEFGHYSCSNCGHEHFISTRKNISSDLYENDADYNADLAVAKNHRDLLQWNHINVLQYLKDSHCESLKSILDIGCFNGFFVRELLDKGFNAEGIDFNCKALAFGREHYLLGNHISNRTIDELVDSGRQFDVVTMLEVIEHLEQFSDVVFRAIKLIRPGGVLIISTPNASMTWRPALDSPPHHLSRFTPAALRSLIQVVGLEVTLHTEQTSSFDLVRNLLGSAFRAGGKQSMRGGEFRNQVSANFLRVLANRSKWMIYRIISPIDWLAHKLGIRYISQLIIAKKAS